MANVLQRRRRRSVVEKRGTSRTVSDTHSPFCTQVIRADHRITGQRTVGECSLVPGRFAEFVASSSGSTIMSPGSAGRNALFASGKTQVPGSGITSGRKLRLFHDGVVLRSRSSIIWNLVNVRATSKLLKWESTSRRPFAVTRRWKIRRGSNYILNIRKSDTRGTRVLFCRKLFLRVYSQINLHASSCIFPENIYLPKRVRERVGGTSGTSQRFARRPKKR